MTYETLMMIYTLMIYVFVFILGICIGSFLNVCAYRIPLGVSVSKGRSFCPKCHHQLNYLDLLPLFSYLFLKGRCRYCKEKISPRYFMVELLTGVLFVLAYKQETNMWLLVLNLVAICNLIVVGLIDYDSMDIYDFSHYIFVVLGIIRFIVLKDLSLQSMLLGAIVTSGVLLIVYFLSHGGIGLGDVKLMASAGFYVGLANSLVSFVLGVVLAGVVGMILLLQKNKSGKDMMALGPYLAMGLVLSMLYGNNIVTWYLSLMS